VGGVDFDSSIELLKLEEPLGRVADWIAVFELEVAEARLKSLCKRRFWSEKQGRPRVRKNDRFIELHVIRFTRERLLISRHPRYSTAV
jgi:hypothetical protein